MTPFARLLEKAIEHQQRQQNAANEAVGGQTVIEMPIKHKHQRHGWSRTRLYQCWMNMRKRCYWPTDKEFKNYGARGILVCEEWHDFMSFKDWATHNGYAENLTLDRINSNKSYCPENCRWATNAQQTQNQRKRLSRSKYRGIIWIPDRKRWSAKIVANRKVIYLGYFKEEVDAAIAYNEAAKKYHGDFACLNEIIVEV